MKKVLTFTWWLISSPFKALWNLIRHPVRTYRKVAHSLWYAFDFFRAWWKGTLQDKLDNAGIFAFLVMYFAVVMLFVYPVLFLTIAGVLFLGGSLFGIPSMIKFYKAVYKPDLKAHYADQDGTILKKEILEERKQMARQEQLSKEAVSVAITARKAAEAAEVAAGAGDLLIAARRRRADAFGETKSLATGQNKKSQITAPIVEADFTDVDSERIPAIA